ncbi:HupE/UreJ family protein [Photobacterium lipolyticum]|uniref:Urease accessory protein n=1 Tax=Photobacterium lipolyticum TaxID=266810 RepID=A0A2T3MW75_9GAMM|nr:HupE/UreJ family protein [Photobacterium lipolyticum]PSW04204.1 urease accessory protein [Photobacterium lipolyticum]
MKKFVISLLALAIPMVASAHSGHLATTSLSGFLHPFTGGDHIAAMVAVGLWAAVMGGKALWHLPLAFVAAMLAGAVFAVVNIQLPAVEFGIALSVVVMGLVLAVDIRPGHKFASVLVMVFALFHGHAHGLEMPVASSTAIYFTGFLAATLALHVSGMALGQLVIKARLGQWAFKMTGAIMALFGGMLLLN